MAVLPTGIGPVTGYNIERSLRFNSADDAYVSRTFSTPTNNKKWSYSVWMKRSAFAANQTIMSSNVDGAEYWDMRFNTSDQILVQNRVGSSNLLLANTTAVYRDPSAWYHIVFVFDSDNATAAFRNRLYVNNVEYTLSANSGSGNASAWNVNAIQHNIGVSRTLTTGGGIWAEFSGYETEIYFIDGQALTPSSFGETDSATGVWKPKAFSGTYGTNGFFLKFADNSNTTAATLGKDSSGNGNNWTPNNFSVTAGAGNDSLVDTPTSYGTDTGVGGTVRGNYCTLNPLDKGTNATLANGNLFGSTSTTAWAMIRSTFAISSGKWYWEFTVATTQIIIGLAKSNASLANYVGADANGWGWYGATGNKVNGGTQVTYVGVWAANDVIGVSFDADVGTLVFYKNGTSQGTAYTGLTSGPYFPAISFSAASDSANANFGQRAFAYTAPSGFKALCTQNLPTPTIGATSTTQANDYMNVVLYTGNGSTQSITGVGFQPDWVWLKSRSNATDNELIDAVRGATKSLVSNSTAVEATDTNGLTAFSSDGFSLGTDANYNGSARTYVAWNWKANGAGSSNTAGTITSTVSANTTSGFSIVTFNIPGSGTSDTVGHGLGVAPSMVILKPRTAGTSWGVYHSGLTSAAYYLTLQTTNAQASSNSWWNSTAPTSSVFTIGATWYGTTNAVAYCFAPVAGYSAFGSYVGNGSTDGVFVYTGFRPAYVLIKSSSQAGTEWEIRDDLRLTYNPETELLFANASNATYATDPYYKSDFLSNGFKLRNTNSASNGSGYTYIYMAFAENPFKYSLAR